MKVVINEGVFINSNTKYAMFNSHMDNWQKRFFLICIIYLCLFSIFPVSVTLAETDSGATLSPDRGSSPPVQAVQEEGIKLNADYLRGYVSDTGKILSSPWRWDGKDWLTASLVVSAVAGLYAYDQDLKEWFQDKRNSTTNDIAKIFNNIGNPLYAVPAMGLIYIYGEHQESEKAKRIGLLGIESIALSGAFTTAIKFATQRSRPDSGERYNKWDGPGFSTDNLSFPSLHTSTAFSMAKVIASETDSPYIAPVVYGIASLVGLARLNDNEHWSSDAFIGAAIGYFTATAVLRYHKQSSPVSLMPSVSHDGCGVLVVYRY